MLKDKSQVIVLERSDLHQFVFALQGQYMSTGALSAQLEGLLSPLSCLLRVHAGEQCPFIDCNLKSII